MRKLLSGASKLALRLFINFTLLFIVAVLFAPVDTAINAAAAATAVSFALQTYGLFKFGTTPNTLAFMGLQVELWHKDIVENIFKDNQFLNYAFNADDYVLQGKVVHIPQAGTPPAVKINRSQLPAQVTVRDDSDVTYTLDEITTDPVLIKDADQYELSYNKRQSVLMNSHEANKEAAAELMLHKWASGIPATSLLQTTGSSVTPHLDNATGSRKAITLKDIIAAQKLMNKQGISKMDRYILLDADMMSQLREEMTSNQDKDFSSYQDVPNGIIGRLYGFNFLERESTVAYAGGSTPTLLALGAVTTTTSSSAAIFWQKNSVERAMGEVKLFENIQDATMYGDVYSTLVRMGGRVRRGDGKGVGAIVQAIV